MLEYVHPHGLKCKLLWIKDSEVKVLNWSNDYESSSCSDMLSEQKVLAEESEENVCWHVYLLCCAFKFSRHEIITCLMKWQLQKQESLLVPVALRVFLDIFHLMFHRFHWNSRWISEVFPLTSKESVLPPAGRWLGWIPHTSVWKAACLTASRAVITLPLWVQFVEYITKAAWEKYS